MSFFEVDINVWPIHFFMEWSAIMEVKRFCSLKGSDPFSEQKHQETQ
ncbi:hypothetical protein KP78_13280 [Jeotgalibacillus soli]|uniref:Uncharacterized protein n=1 Tax=Jeotgalibacillus soli TaxID=889306 RepID=A0A0C2RI71_9BACL|nr:hypothetical protein KP78_13280 [Jeotgalibacillus soli]